VATVSQAVLGACRKQWEQSWVCNFWAGKNAVTKW